MMRLFTLMYDVAVSRLDSTTFRRVAQHKIADHRNIRRYMRVIQCALVGQLIDFPECTAAGGMVFYPKDHQYIDQHSTKKRSKTHAVQPAKRTQKEAADSTQINPR